MFTRWFVCSKKNYGIRRQDLLIKNYAYIIAREHCAGNAISPLHFAQFLEADRQIKLDGVVQAEAEYDDSIVLR